MCGMLFQACVPRLCHLGWIWGGKVKACIQGWQRWWHRAMGNHQRERSPGTPLRNGILGLLRPPAWLSLTEIRAPDTSVPSSSSRRPVSSLWGPAMPRSRRPTTGSYSHQQRASDTTTTMGAMIVAASPRRWATGINLCKSAIARQKFPWSWQAAWRETKLGRGSQKGLHKEVLLTRHPGDQERQETQGGGDLGRTRRRALPSERDESSPGTGFHGHESGRSLSSRSQVNARGAWLWLGHPNRKAALFLQEGNAMWQGTWNPSSRGED